MNLCPRERAAERSCPGRSSQIPRAPSIQVGQREVRPRRARPVPDTPRSRWGKVWHPADLPRAITLCPRGGRWFGRNVAPGLHVVGLRQAVGIPHGPQRARSTLGPSSGHRTSRSIEKPGQVARAFLLVNPAASPRWSRRRSAGRTSWPISRILDDRTILTPKGSQLSHYDRLDTLWSQNPSR